MAADVGLRPALPQTAHAGVGRAVRGVTWLDMARATNCVLGRGCQPVPIGSPINTAISAGTTYTWGWRVIPRYQAFARVWQIVARSNSGTTGSTISVAAPSGGTAVSHAVGRYIRTATPIYHFEALSAQSAAETTLTLDIAPVGNDVIVESVGCVDIPRASLATTGDDLGIDLNRAVPWQPIWASNVAVSSDGGWHRLVDILSSQANIGRRVSHLAWGVPYLAGGSTTTTWAVTVANGGGSKNLFALNPPVIARRGQVAVSGPAGTPTAQTVEQRALCWVSVGTVTGRVTFTYTSGATSNATTSSTTPTWLSPSDNTIRQEDPAQTTGLYSDSFANEEVAITLDVTAGTGSVYCAAATIFESA